jgi:N-acyl-D-aspartate/D-glutamate deacylase
MYDTLIHGGTLIDGTGALARRADIGVLDGRIAEIAPRLTGAAQQVIDAEGLLVTPGFVDIHTHYDGQLTWDSTLEPSFSHGVTTVVAGNCGVGFAPVKPAERQSLIQLMEGVEDIPGTALHEGIQWEWESFPGYLDALGRRRYSMDVGVMVPHGALRTYVMGERGIRNETASSDDLTHMAALMDEALCAGALGFSTSRVLEHQSTAGGVVPGTFASVDELLAIAEPLARRRAGLLQMVPRGVVGGVAGKGIGGASDTERLAEAAIAAQLAITSRRPVTYTVLDDAASPGLWKRTLALFEDAVTRGAVLYPQVSSRGVGILTGFSGNHLFQRRRTYLSFAHLPLEKRLAQLRRAEIRSAILADEDVAPESSVAVSNRHLMFARLFHLLYPLDEETGPEPDAAHTIASLAAVAGMDPQAYLYDYMLRKDGRQFAVMIAANYNGSSYESLYEMIAHPQTILGLSDAGAHVSVLCDASNPTFQLSFWARDRLRGPRFPIEFLVKKQTGDTARAAGLTDRGVVAVGMRADINVIDMQKLALQAPLMVNDLPCAGARLLQGSCGYAATLVAGVCTRRLDADTGRRPGRLIRGQVIH